MRFNGVTSLALDLLQKMLSFDPSTRISIPDALAHPWLASYHEETDEPDCPTKFEKWRDIEKLETLEDFRKALQEEIEDYRMEVRGITREPTVQSPHENARGGTPSRSPAQSLDPRDSVSVSRRVESPEVIMENEVPESLAPPAPSDHIRPSRPADPVVNYARRSSMIQPRRSTSTYSSPQTSTAQQQPFFPMFDGLPTSASGIAFPNQGYILPARSRAASTAAGSEVAARKLLRTLSTVSIHESVEGLPGGIGKFIVGQESGADAPPSEMPIEFSVDARKEKDRAI